LGKGREGKGRSEREETVGAREKNWRMVGKMDWMGWSDRLEVFSGLQWLMSYRTETKKEKEKKGIAVLNELSNER
jgi:hypothetical protein